jgi:hypothetical protein
MAGDAISEHVFLDTQVFVQFGFKYSSTAFKSLIDLVGKGRLKLITTPIVIGEVEAQIEKAVRAAGAAHKRFAKEARVLGSCPIGEVAGKIEKFDEEAAVSALKESFHRFLSDNKAETADLQEISVDDLIGDYFKLNPPSNSGDKKAEFPDAITVKALASWAENAEAQLLVVGGDKGVIAACAPIDLLIGIESLQKMLDHVADDDKKVADFIRKQVNERAEDIGEQVGEGFEDRFLFLLDETGGEAEVTVQKASLTDVKILEVADKEATVEVSFLLEYEADTSYDDPDMTAYDSETGTSWSWRKEHATVNRETIARAEVGVLFEGLDADEFDINYLTVTVPADSFGITLHDPRDLK